jgi:cytochrome P450 family 130
MALDTSPLVYDPMDPATQRDPYPIYRRLREEDPVHRTTRGFWVLSRFEDVYQAALDTTAFSSAQGLTFEKDEIASLGLKPTLVMMDRPRHTTFRRLISRGFTPRKVAGLEPMLRAFVRGRLSMLSEAAEADFVEVLAGPLPTLVVATYLGVPESDRTQFDAWSSAIVEAGAANDIVGQAADAVAGLYAYFTELLEFKRQHPGDDMLTDLVGARVDGHALHLDEILGYCFVMIAGGNDTASGLLSGSSVLLSDDMRQRTVLLDDPRLLTPALEELLRLTSPVQGLSRTATCDVDLHDVTIPAGSKVHLLYGSANRDPREFGSTADELHVCRTFRRMLSFGNGPHHCIGAAAARLQARVALGELLRQFPDFRVDVSRARLSPGPFVRRYEFLPIAPGRRRHPTDS